jgi:hypothetical protein
MSAQQSETVIEELTPNAPVPNPLTANLLVDPGAESGLSGWIASSSESAPDFFPAAHSGSYSFLGAALPDAFLSQTIKLAGVTGITLDEVDAGDLAANYSFWFADSHPGSGAYGRITLTFFDASGNKLGQGLSASLSDSGAYAWTNSSGSFAIPARTRSIVYTMDFNTTSLTINSGLIDDNVLTIGMNPPPE